MTSTHSLLIMNSTGQTGSHIRKIKENKNKQFNLSSKWTSMQENYMARGRGQSLKKEWYAN